MKEIREVSGDFRFPEDYQCVCFFSSDALSIESSTRINRLAKRILGHQCRMAMCLGKYDFVIEFPAETVMQASYGIGELQLRIKRIASIGCSSSLYLCKQIYSTSSTDRDSPLRSFSFVRPAGIRYPSKRLFNAVEYAADGITSAKVLWNSTSYSAIVEMGDNDAQRLVEGVIRLREKMGKSVTDTSTIVALRVGSDRPFPDKQHGASVPCIIHVKMRGFDVESWREKRTVLGTPATTLGWFDFTFQCEFDSVSSLVRALLGFRRKHRSEIAETETIILQRMMKA